MKKHSPQSVLMERIQLATESEEPLAQQLMELLNVSRDSAYRRLRGETALTLDESILLAKKYRIPLSEIAGQSDQSAIFNKQPFIKTLEDFENYQRRSLEQLEYIEGIPNHLLTYSAKDIPVFYQFAFPKLAAFKIFVWLKSVYHIEKINGAYLGLEQIPKSLTDIALRQWQAYSRIHSIEIWNDSTVLSLVNQIAYYYEAGLLKNRAEALQICDEFQEMTKLIFHQVTRGGKSHSSQHEIDSSANYKMYYHEILLMDNHLLAEFPTGQKIYFIPYAGVNYFSTSDINLTNEITDYLKGQCKKSSLISDASEKERNRFFLKMRHKLDQLREKINSTDPFI